MELPGFKNIPNLTGATAVSPWQEPTGMKMVLINGQVVYSAKEGFRGGCCAEAMISPGEGISMKSQFGVGLWRCLLAGMALYFTTALAGAQTWLPGPGSGDWNTGSNWDLGTPPNGTSASATMGTSSITALSLSAGVTLGGLLFNGGSSYDLSTGGNPLAFAGTGIINASGAPQTLDNNGGNVLFENSSQVSGVLMANAASSTIVFEDSSAAGSATILNDGVLNFTGNASAANAQIVTNSVGAVSFSGGAQGGQASFGSSSGAVFDISQSSAGAVTVGSVDGGGSLNLGANNLFTGINGLSTTVSGVIGGSGGSLTKAGTGTFTLTGANSYSGGTSIIGGTLVVDDGTLGSGGVYVYTLAGLNYIDHSVAANSITNSGSLSFDDSSGAGSSTITNSGNLNFNNSSTANAAMITNGNAITFNNSSTAASAVIANGGVIYFNDASTAGNATLTNNGALFFAGDAATTLASAGDAQITDNQFVDFGAYSTAGNAQITVNNGAQANFSGNSQGGTAQITVNNGGNFNIGSSTAAGVTVGSLEGTGGSSFSLGANCLTTGVNNLSTTVSGVIEDGGLGGSLCKVGTGTLSLTGGNPYAGGTSLLDGALALGNSNALGTGSVVVMGGNLKTSGGPLVVNIGGNYTQASEGTIQLRLGGTTAGLWDALNITGTAALAGTLSVDSYSGFTPSLGDSFEILSAAGVSGHFSALLNSIGGFRLLPVYYPAQVDIVAIQPSFAQLGQTLNERGVGKALDNLFPDPAQQALMLSLGTQSTSSLPKDYDRISPAGITPLFQMGFAMEESRGLLAAKRISDFWEQTDSQSGTAFAGQGRRFASTMSPGRRKRPPAVRPPPTSGMSL